MQTNTNLHTFMNVIKAATNSQDATLRPQAEQQIMQYLQSNPGQLFLDCSIILATDSFQTAERQLGGTVASRLLNRMNEANKNAYFWDEVSRDVKSQIKHNLLDVLICPNNDVVRAAAQTVAVIASIELPRNEWEDIVDILAKNCTNDDQYIKRASIITLGYICEQIKTSGQAINNRLSEQILASIIIAAREENEFLSCSLKALEDSMQFVENLLQQPNYRDTVFTVLVNNFRNQKEQENTYLALFEFVKYASPYLTSYQDSLTQLTEAHLARRDMLTDLNLQMWESIGLDFADKLANAKERIGEQNIGDNLLQAVSGQLLPQIMKCLLIMNKTEEEDGGEMRISAARALEAFVKVCDMSVVDTITRSVTTILTSTDQYHQQATVTLFSTICEYPDRHYVQEMFKNGFEHLFGLVMSNNKIVVKSSLLGFVRLSESYPEVFLTHQNISEIIDTIMGYMRVEVNEVRENAITILLNISEGLKDDPFPVCDNPQILLTKMVQFYSQNMQRLHKQHQFMNQKTITIIMNIVMHTNKREVIIQLIEFMIDEYYKITNSNLEDIAFLVEQILSVLHTSILAHKNSVPNNQILQKICILINCHLNKYGVEAEGLSLLGALATTFNKSFESKANTYWSTVQEALQKTNELATFKAALACVGDFARMMESCFFTNATEVMKLLIKYLNENLDREIKLQIISCMGDLILSIQDYASNFMDDIINIFNVCFSAVYEYSANNNSNDMDYVQELKANLIEMYSCVVFAANGKRISRRLVENYGNLATFIVRTCDKRVRPTVEYLKNCLYLLHDSAAFYWSGNQNKDLIKKVTESKEIAELVQLIHKFDNRQDIKELLDFINARKMI